MYSNIKESHDKENIFNYFKEVKYNIKEGLEIRSYNLPSENH